MKDKVYELLNDQVRMEFASGWDYLGFAAYFDALGLTGFSHWYKIQAMEEQAHAMKIYDYLIKQGKKVELQEIPAPAHNFDGVSDVLNKGMEHEVAVSKAIHNICALADSVEDYATKNFLEWFVKEQVEEESNARELIEQLELFGTTPDSLYLLDRACAARRK
ncbi:MAG: ferritin [Treponemataceae bacterium]|nr:ferritin [Treponemataceae bacterium]